MLGSLAELLPVRSRCVLVDGPVEQAKLFAARLAGELGTRRRPALVTPDADRPRDVSIFLRTAPGGRHFPVYRKDSGDDLPAYCAAVDEAGIKLGGLVVDIGCGTGRALPPLRMAVGPAGAVIALDITPEMLAVARPAAALAGASLVLADARALPFPGGSVDAIFAAGLVNHLPDTEAGLRELARVTRPGGLLVLFHPSGRAALAARHGHALSPDEPLAEGPLCRSTAAAGWEVTAYDDAPHRFFAVAERR